MTLEPRQRFARAVRRFDELTTRRVVLWVAWGLFLIYCYPGYMSTDSVDQLQQARGMQPFHDWHPPMMALLWRPLDWLIAGPFLMLVVQSTAFLFGLDGILRRFMSPRAAAIVAALIFLWPPVMVVMAVIWKDSQMAAFLLAGTACLLSERRRWKVIGCVFLFLASGQRFNAAAATLPLVGLLFVWPGSAGLRRYAIAAAVWLTITTAAFGANALIAERKTYPWHGSVALFDIAGTVKYAPRMSDDEVRARLTGMTIIPSERLQGHMRTIYSPRAWYWLANTETRVIAAPQDATQRAAVTASWKRMVTAYPIAYLQHRKKVFRELLGMTRGFELVVWSGFSETDSQWLIINHRAMHSTTQEAWIGFLTEHENSLMFRPWAYALLALALLLMCRRQRLAFALLSSGIVCELSLFFSAPSADYRYSHWMITSTIMGAALVFTARLRSAAVVPPS